MLDLKSGRVNPKLAALPLRQATQEFRAALVLHHIVEAEFSTVVAAQRLGVDPSYLRRLMREFGLRDPKNRDKMLTEPLRERLEQRRAQAREAIEAWAVETTAQEEARRTAERKTGGPVDFRDLNEPSPAPELAVEDLY